MSSYCHCTEIFLFIYCNWKLITLQYCSSFLPYIHMNQPWVYMCSQSWTPFPPPSPSHPSGSPQCTSPEHPVSCIKHGLAICFTYDNIHVSMLFSQITHPRLLPQSPIDCSIHLCLFCCLAYMVIVTIFLNSIYELVYCIGVFLSGLLHSIIGSSFIHLIRTDSNVFFLLAE